MYSREYNKPNDWLFEKHKLHLSARSIKRITSTHRKREWEEITSEIKRKT